MILCIEYWCCTWSWRKMSSSLINYSKFGCISTTTIIKPLSIVNIMNEKWNFRSKIYHVNKWFWKLVWKKFDKTNFRNSKNSFSKKSGKYSKKKVNVTELEYKQNILRKLCYLFSISQHCIVTCFEFTSKWKRIENNFEKRTRRN